MAKKNIEDMRNKVILGEYGVSHPQTSDFPGSYHDYDDAWSLKKFQKNFQIDIKEISNNGNDIEFDMVHIDCSVANAFRRILLSEVPTMAIDRVCILNNTSLIQDEVLAHRIGLIPIKADPRMFEYRSADDTEPTEHDSIQFNLKVKCTRKSDSSGETSDPDHLYNNHKVTTADFKWKPLGNQANMFKKGDIHPVHNDILIAKLRPGQEIDLQMYCFKGLGKTHAKFSPVATATYRLLPDISLLEPIKGELAKMLKKCFANGVIGINDQTGEAYVKDARRDNCSREVLRHEDLKNHVQLSRIRDHFIFNVESTGCLPVYDLICQAIEVLMTKCKKFIDILDNVDNEPEDDDDE